MSDRFTSHSRFGEIYNGKRGYLGALGRDPGYLRTCRSLLFYLPPSLFLSLTAPCPPCPLLNSTRPSGRELKRAGVQTQSGLEERDWQDSSRLNLVSLLRQHSPPSPSVYDVHTRDSLPELSGQGQKEAKIAVRSGSYLGRYTGIDRRGCTRQRGWQREKVHWPR